jgi:triacylglycerol lipase
MPPLDHPIPPLHGHHRLPTLRTRVSETIATLREVVLMPRSVRSVVPDSVDHADDVVVLVHGFFATAGVFGPMKESLVHDVSAKVASFTHAPGEGVERIAKSLAKLVELVPSHARVHLVGHSLGGLVARWYVQELGGHERVAQTISLGSPFGGTERARRFRFLVGADLHRTSPVLARLRQRAHEHDVPHTSIVASGDTMIVPAESAIFPRGDVFVLNGGHNSLLFHPESIARVVDRVERVKRLATQRT